MSDLVSLEQAAQLLGISTDELNDLRLKNEIFGTRDGTSWKFKMDEIRRVADARGVSLSDDMDFEVSDSAISLSDSAELITGGSSGSGISDVLSEDDDDLSFGSSDIALASGSSDENVLADDEPSEKGSPSDTGKLLSDSADLELSEDDLFDDDISLQDSPGLVDSSDLSSDFEDSDLVLEDSDSSDEPALEAEAAESGINLSPTDSGISLDEPFNLGAGSDIDDLELPDDDDVIALEESAGPDSSTLLKSDDDFNLTPLEDDALEDSSSGSQVIALEDSAIYTDDSSPTMLSSETHDEAAPEMLDADAFHPGEAAVTPVVIPEAPYTLFNILSLALALVLVLLGTMVAFDLARNMWQPEGTTLSSTVANFFINLAGFES